MTTAGGIHIDGPGWLGGMLLPALEPGAADHDRMAWVLDVLDRQVAEQTGGPFAAAVFSGVTGTVLGVAVNRVEPSSACIAHAELLALAQAGQAIGSYTLAGHGAVLVTSTEPCAMCLGAVEWSGVARVVCAATERDARDVGFDEGDKPAHWRAALAARGIAVAVGVHHARAAAAMHRYVEQGGTVYNGGGA
jgi:tRNA(Arg) A34 adenosine deaminase TadA